MQSDSIPPNAGRFATTHWTRVIEAKLDDSSLAKDALEILCQTYWYPLYAYVRRQGFRTHDAQDLTQEFFSRFLEKNYLKDVEQSKGKFRSFLLAALKHFLANEWDKLKALKRGGGKTFVSMEAEHAETKYSLEPAHELTADKMYDRRWALTLLENVLKKLRDHYAQDGKTELFEELKATLVGKKESVPYSEIALKLNMKQGTVKVAVHRLRQRYASLLRDEVASTVSCNQEIDTELKSLFEALGAGIA